jgi:hypothetical protein
MADESQIDPTNQKVGVLLSYGVPEEDIVARLSQSDDPEHQNWVRQYKAQQVEKELKAKAGLTQSPVQNNEDAIKKQAELINQPSQVGPGLGKLAEIGVVGKVGYELGKQIPAAVEYGSKLFGTLKDKMAVPPTVEAPPVAETAPSGVAKLQERFNLVPKKESTPEETRQQRLKAATAAAQGEMTPVVPGAAAPAAAVAAVVPPASVALPATPVAEVPASPIATPASAVMETPENPVAKAAALVEGKTPVAPVAPVVEAVIPPAEVTPGAAAILETQTPAATTVTAKQEKKIKGAVAPTGPIQTVKTGSGLDAYLGQGAAKERIPSAFKTAAEIPAGYAFVPGADIGGMNTARNRLGQEGYTEFVKAQGTPFGTYDETQKVLKSLDENRIGPTLTREQRKTIGAPMLPTTSGLGGKAIKVGGVAGALLAVSELASAQSLSEAGSKALEIGSSLLPVPLQGAMFSGGTNANETEQLAYLRRMEQAKLRGAGNRGMAYDPRIPYNPQFMNVGIPPPFNR